ncbi:putative cytochrome P450 12d1 proximal, mitochondrial [Trichoplax sp. H2]|nr:putative cytochrome P450 12d1 proximal, mitochondrial [Trichoplax sp. H2]|eukprot:RDD43570.1 putative cytochrome P450 12d1 proximal, mitochondrial [Trichoplax sp. H2]
MWLNIASANIKLWTLYILGKNLDIQEKLNQEYVQYSFIPIVPRLVEKDIVLGGYQIPAKVCSIAHAKYELIPLTTRVLAGFSAMSYDESIHDEPTKIKPERWMRSSSKRRLDPYTFTTFSFGPRMCISSVKAIK